ncbi:MAG: hypothetical protein IJP54_03830 [Synergistaceae bacterium]|nr:hypothetical protein [Synergistaceae bacterium]MBR0034787.1 hypothetical protein [Synergistaceae bacterium]
MVCEKLSGLFSWVWRYFSTEPLLLDFLKHFAKTKDHTRISALYNMHILFTRSTGRRL